MKMENIFQLYDNKMEDCILKNKAVEYVQGKMMKLSELSDKYVWKRLLKTKKAADAVGWAVIGFNAYAVFGQIGYGVLTNNLDLTISGVENHILADLALISLAKTNVRYLKRTNGVTL